MVNKYYEKNREKVIERSKIFNRNNPNRKTTEFKEENKAYCKEWRKRNKEYEKKRYELDKFVILVRTETRERFERASSCDKCGSTDKLEFHHWVYERPVKKEHFSTLCNSCHIKEHPRETLK